ncbi:MAG: class I SAM-dependent methyltransferase [Candidatus Harrisonbacteria bacterium]|nr:class I SAM-dependent methyltransferase [Candidatus Harrisonbacteria bacterium]
MKKEANKIFERNKSVWDNLKISSMNLDVNFVRCQKYLFPEGRKKKLLYIGFGEGQNLEYLAKAGFDVYGTEIAESRVGETKKRLKKNKLKARLYLVKSSALPFQDGFFDIVVAWQSIYYNDENGLKAILKEINRALKPKGQFLSSMISTKQNLLCSKKIGLSTYRPAKKTGQQNCTIFCFKNKNQIRKLYGDFARIKIGFYSSYLFKSRNFHYVIYCVKTKHSLKELHNLQ